MRKYLPLFAVVVMAVIVLAALKSSINFKYDVLMSRAAAETDSQKIFPLLDKAIKTDKKRSDAYERKFKIYMDWDNYCKALETADMQVRAAYSPDAFANRAVAYIMLGMQDKAAADLQTLNSFNAQRPVYYFDAASAFCAAGNYDKALEYLQKARQRVTLKSDFFYFGARYMAGVMHLKQGKYEAAFKDVDGLDGAVSARPELLSSLNNLRARIKLAQKKYKDAMAFSALAVKNVQAKLAASPGTKTEEDMRLLCQGKIKAYSFEEVFNTNAEIKAKLQPPSKPAAKSAAKPAAK